MWTAAGGDWSNDIHFYRNGKRLTGKLKEIDFVRANNIMLLLECLYMYPFVLFSACNERMPTVSLLRRPRGKERRPATTCFRMHELSQNSGNYVCT